MILDHTVDAAAIDSNTWAAYQRQFPERASSLVKLTSFGPMPVYPMVFNSRLQGMWNRVYIIWIIYFVWRTVTNGTFFWLI